MRKLKKWSKLNNLTTYAFITLFSALLALFFTYPQKNFWIFIGSFFLNFGLLYFLRRFGIFKNLFEEETYSSLGLVVLFLVSLALLGTHFNWFHLAEVKESYYLLLLGSIVGVLSRIFLRKRPIREILLFATYAVLLASKNIFVTVGFALANLISADIYGRYRKTSSEILAVAAGNAVFTLLLVGYMFTVNPSKVWECLLLYPLSVFTEIFLLFGLQKILDLLPYMYSDEKLENFANLSNPLLEEMLLRAPGTYHHSVMVSLLSESIAKKIGADPLLVKVGAMFHDIGKLINPQYFIENVNGSNPHSSLRPEASAAIIKNHVEEGLKLAKKHKLPKEIIPFIPEHQGTKLIRYFYIKALEENPNTPEEKFRYRGPIPQSKETAIVMIVDTVEAMVRALKNPSPDDIKATVHRAIENLLKEEQLKDSGLTEEELKRIEKLLVELILSYYHERIKYPEKEIKKRAGAKN